MDEYTCSFCQAKAVWVGSGQDGDFYCRDHIYRAPGGVDKIEEDN